MKWHVMIVVQLLELISTTLTILLTRKKTFICGRMVGGWLTTPSRANTGEQVQ